MIDLGPPPQFCLPRPAIIRQAELLRPEHAKRGTFPFPIISSRTVTYDSFNPLDIDPSTLVLSVGNRLVTRSSFNAPNWGSVRSTKFRSSGKYYFEFNTNFPGVRVLMGLCLGSTALNNYIGASNTGISVGSNGAVNTNGSGTIYLSAFSSGSIGSIAVDFGAQLLWVRNAGGQWNGSGTADPTTGVGGIAFPGGITAGSNVYVAASCYAQFDAISANFGNLGFFTYTVPSGYSAWG